MSSGNRWPLAMYSNANRMKINVETSSTQNASIAIVYDVKNCSSAVRTDEIRKTPSVVQAGGSTKYFRQYNMNSVSGSAAIAKYVNRPETKRHSRNHK